MIHTNEIWPRCQASMWCENQHCQENVCATSTDSEEDAIAEVLAKAEAHGWTLDGGRHYCPEHKPVVIDANQMELEA